MKHTSSKRIPIGKILLYTIATAGIISMALVAPNALQSLKLFGFGKRQKKYPTYQINSAVQRLVRRGFLVFEDAGEKKFLRLTSKGEKELVSQKIKNGKKKHGAWDKKWRLVVFDIGEYRRGTRDLLRRELSSFGFARLQNSVWVYPYDCEDFIVMLKSDFKIGKSVLYVVADRIENDRYLKELFGLS